MKKYNYVYITTDISSGKHYIGDHSTNNLEDEYLGSGILIQRAIKKHGGDNFKKEILELFDSKEEAFNAQEGYIKEYNTLSPNGYNISPKGGIGVNGCHSNNTKNKISISLEKYIRTEEHRKNISISKTGNKNPNYGKSISEKHKESIIISNKKRKGNNHYMYGKTHTEESKEKMRKPKRSMAKDHKQNMSKSHMGKFYINNGIITKQLKKGDDIPEGWKIGRKDKDKNKDI
jgi:group I intron endonuclease